MPARDPCHSGNRERLEPYCRCKLDLMLSGRLLLRSTSSEVTHEYQFSTGGELMAAADAVAAMKLHRFVDDTGNSSKSAGSFTPAPEHLVRELIQHYPAQLESLCREAGIDFEKFAMRFQAAG